MGNANAECTKSKVTCEECADKGHLTKHCWVRNDKVLPAYMSAEKKTSITAKRLAYQAGKASMGMTAIKVKMAKWQTEFKEDDDNFLDVLDREYGKGI